MADEKVDPGKTNEKAAPAAASADDVKNLKAEFDRKLTNLDATNKQLVASLQALAKQVAPPVKKEPEAKTKKLQDVWYDDPETSKKMIVEETLSILQSQQQKGQEAAQKTQKIMQALQKDFPELKDIDDPLSQKAIEIFEKYSEEEKQNPIAYKLAVKEAAEEIGVKPKSKRTSSDDDDAFSLSQSTAKGGREHEPGKRRGKLDPRTMEFAKLMGVDVENEKVVESLKTRQREVRDWMKYN
jgi:hypothetical protein